MEISVKVVVFEHPEPQTFGNYCGYCAANGYFCSGANVGDISDRVKDVISLELQQREKYPVHLLKFGWEITKNSIKVPIFTDEELVQRAESSYVLKIDNPIIVEINVELPKAQALF